MDKLEDIFKEPWFVKQLMDAGMYADGKVVYLRCGRGNVFDFCVKATSSKWNKRTIYYVFRLMCHILDDLENSGVRKIVSIDYLKYLEKVSLEVAPGEMILAR